MDAHDDADALAPSAGRALNLRQIEVFRAIMMAGSISGAGRMLHVSQPAVSRVLALTESRLGYRLFERVKSRLSPTAEARRLYAEVEQVYGGIQRVNDRRPPWDSRARACSRWWPAPATANDWCRWRWGVCATAMAPRGSTIAASRSTNWRRISCRARPISASRCGRPTIPT